MFPRGRAPRPLISGVLASIGVILLSPAVRWWPSSHR